MSTIPQSNSRESGAGIVMFLIIGAVLLGLTAGGAYLARQRGEVAANGTSQPDNKNQADKPPAQPDKANKPNAQPDTANQQGNDAPPRTDQPSPAPPQQAAPQPAAGPNQQPATPAAGQAPSSSPSVVASTGPDTIASTGAAENLALAGFGLAALTLAGIKYSQSRQRFNSSIRQQ